MRKITKMAGIACLGLLLSTQNSNAQTQSDFESLTLSPNSFWDGSDMSGTHNAGIFNSTFADGTAIFNNVYDTSYGAAYAFWLVGFAYSNMTDSITSGVGNKYSARAGSGQGGSPNYAISQNNSTVVLTGGALNNVVNGFYVTNSTYTANSMRDGDAFAKKFGGVSGNDPDWYKLTIWGYTGGNITIDSVEFYLADYRFANNTQDYIIKDWQWVDLTSLGNIDSVYFQLSSSDNGAFGMNTPAFFCIDNFNDQTTSTKESEIADVSIVVYPNPAKDKLFITLNNRINQLEIIDLTGKTIMVRENLTAGKHSIKLNELISGIYFVKTTTTNNIQVMKFIKQ